MTPACASHSKTIIEENQTGITITLAAVSAGTPQIVNLFVTPQIPLDHVYVHHLRQPVRRRHAHTVQQIQQLLCWLGQRQDGECRQPVLGDLAIASGLVAGPKRFERLLKYAITDGYLVQHRLGISITGGSPIGLVDWTTLGEGLYHGLTQTLPRPTFYRQAIGRHKSADQVYLALETRDWLLRTGYVARPDDIWMLPARRHIESRAQPGTMFVYDPDILIERADSLLQVELETGAYGPTQSWYHKWHELGYLRPEIGIVTTTARQMAKIMAAIDAWRRREPTAPRRTRFWFTNLATLYQRHGPGAADPLPHGQFWLADLAPIHPRARD